MKTYLNTIANSNCLKVLLAVIILDVIFGSLRALKDKEWNSTIGIDGIIRKFGMIVAGIGFLVIDMLLHFNFIGFIPESVRQYLPLTEIGSSSVLNILFIIYELLSILKNMYKCGIPIPKKLEVLLKRLLKDFTSEIEEGNKNEISSQYDKYKN